MLSDDRLARRAAKGDRRAFAAIYKRYHQPLYRFCLAIVGDPQDAQDALQNTMVKVLRGLPGEERRIQLKPWLYRIAHNESVELLRRRRPTEPIDPELIGHGVSPAEEAASRERLRTLISDLEKLPERQRAALVMRELAGLGFDEIGPALGTSPATARQTLYEARLSLRQMEEGREMDCATVTRALSDADGRVTRRRDIRAHLRGCADCRRFREELEARRGDFAVLAPLPAVASAGLLQALLGSHAGTAGGGAAGALGAGAGAGKAVGTSIAVKSVATVAVVATVGFSASRGDLPVVDLGGKGGSTSAPAVLPAPGASGPAPAADRPAMAAVEETRARQRGDRRDGSSSLAETGVSGPGPSGSGGSAEAGTTPPTVPPGASRRARHGSGKALPAAAAHGQQTAAAHKGGRGAKGGGGHSAHPSPPTHPDHPTAPGSKQQHTPPSGGRGSSQPHQPSPGDLGPEPAKSSLTPPAH